MSRGAAANERASEEEAQTSAVRKWAFYLLLLVLAPVAAVLALLWTLIGLFFQVRLYKAVIATWLAVSALFVLALVLDAPSTTVTVLMAAQLAVFAAWSYRVFGIRHVYRSTRAAYTLLFSAAIACLGIPAWQRETSKPFVLAFLVCTLFAALYLGSLVLRIWTMTAWYKLQAAERRLLDLHVRSTVLQRTVGRLGTLAVLADGDELVEDNSQGPSEGSPLLARWLGSGLQHESRKSLQHAQIRRSKEKPTLVMVHGYAAANAYYMLNFDGLSEHFNVYAVELFGCGRSDRLPWTAKNTDQAIDLLSDAIESWRAEIGLEKIVLLGHSLGCIACSAYAMKHPHRVEHLILTSPAGVGHPAQVLRPFWWRAVAYLWECNLTPMDAIRWGGPFGRMISNTMLRGRAQRSPPNSGFLTVIDLDALCEFGYENFAATASGERALARLLHPGAYGKKPIITFLRGGEGGLSSPVSIIYGDHRYDWMESKYGKQLRDQLVAQGLKCTVSEVREAGHILFIDNPEGFNVAIVEAHNKMCGSS